MRALSWLPVFLFFFIIVSAPTEVSGQATMDRLAGDDRSTAERNAVVFLGHCTGTLITDLVVLTAAHCVPPELRTVRPEGEDGVQCATLPDQYALQGKSWEDPFSWHPIAPQKHFAIAFGVDRVEQRMPIRVGAYSIPHCADIALLQLVRRASGALVEPMKVLVAAPPEIGNLDAFLRDARLRYAGWGLGQRSAEQMPNRQTGRVSFWDRNDCLLFTLPPERVGGERVLKGDSGSPLILRHGNTDIVVGVLFGSGIPDRTACGLPLLPPPKRHGAYTPTFRRAIAGTDATDLSAWITHFAPEAVFPPPLTEQAGD